MHLKYLLYALILIYACSPAGRKRLSKAQPYSFVAEKPKDTNSAFVVNESNVQKDSLRIIKFEQILLSGNQDSMCAYFHMFNSGKSNIGFGYSCCWSSIKLEYMVIDCKYVMNVNVLESFILIPKYPKHVKVANRYMKFCNKVFPLVNNRTRYFKYQIELTEKPLEGIKDPEVLNEDLRFLMTPYSGTQYGYSQGWGLTLFSNREIFNNNKDLMDLNTTRTLLYSKNPATRFMAIENYWQNKDEFADSGSLDAWCEKAFKEVPLLSTTSGCLIRDEDTRTLVERYSGIKRSQ